jgi:hypothetical protein
LATALGPQRLILAYFDKIYILSNAPSPWRTSKLSSQVPAPYLTQHGQYQDNGLEEDREAGLQLLGSCIRPTVVTERLLEAKMAAEEALLAKLVHLHHQHALLVLRQYLRQNLRHLQRSLRSDDLGHLWERLDASLANSVRRIGAAAFTALSQTVDNALITLPVRLGGLGILSFTTCSPLVSAGAS